MLSALLSGIPDTEIKEKTDLTKLSTMRLKSQGDLIICRSSLAVSSVVKKLTENRINYRILGLGSNLALAEYSISPYIKLLFPFEKSYLDYPKDEYELPASLGLHHLTAHAIKHCLKGWEVFTGIPATLGGAIFMNAGTGLGEIGPLVTKVTLVDKHGKIREEIMNKSSFSYRKNHFVKDGEVIIGATLKHFGKDKQVPELIKSYLEMRTKTQPLQEKTCGCVFKNHSITCRAGHYLDILNLKGFSYKGLRVSPKHANFIENVSGANQTIFKEFVELIQDELYLAFGIKFELEVIIE